MQRTHRGVALDTVFDENGTRRTISERIKLLLLADGFLEPCSYKVRPSNAFLKCFLPLLRFEI